jgi:hypothetical protein
MGSRSPLYQSVHQKMHARIAQCARCPGAARRDREDARAGVDLVLRDAARRSPADQRRAIRSSPRRVCSGDPARAADEVRRHLDFGMQHAMEVLQPYFKLRKATGRTFYRSDRRLRERSDGSDAAELTRRANVESQSVSADFSAAPDH